MIVAPKSRHTDDCPATSLRLRRNAERGASLVEYALLVALIALVCFVAVMYFGDTTGETFSRVGDSVAAT